MKNEQETLFDKHIGSRIRTIRTLRGMSQTKLAEQLGLTFQQVQKMEKGSNRVGSGRLYVIAQIFDVTASFFFDGIPGQTTSNNLYSFEGLTKRSNLEFMKDVLKLSDNQKKKVQGIVKVIIKASNSTVKEQNK